MTIRTVALMAMAIVPAALGLSSTGAHAAIVCRDGFQVVAGQEISTPYCRDAYLAKVASEHGKPVSAEAIRQNPIYKESICRWVGSDSRVSSYCNDDTGDSDGH